MIDWFSDHAWVTWVGIAVLLAVAELLSLDLVLLMFAVGALGAAVVAGLGGPLWLAIAVFAVVVVALLTLVRPPLVEKLHAGPTLQVGHQSLVGSTAVVLEPVGSFDGRVRLGGELWSARTDDAAQIGEGAQAYVVAIDGATAVVSATLPVKES
ncbi:hypothetical protein ASD11_07185 [Aeromicrobium sp. Root495]|uniref:NfeD family protein n=1 Tax=Aeromicrobium sp. Root495 TaxID=1736550 RepID=UPI0006F2690D|nr:NfeD family protein [Aeromicrobium sp. Root495]KQY59345.1 hypothetical protein ASD11_07185 [Aeromicrobium sp. Root495]